MRAQAWVELSAGEKSGWRGTATPSAWYPPSAAAAPPGRAAGGPAGLLRSPAVYEKKVGKAYLRGCLRSLVVMLVGGVLGTAMLVTVLVLIRGGDVEPRSARFTLALAMPIFFLAFLLAAGALVVALRGRRLDRAFAPWGLHGRQSGAAMRSWHGEFGGRAFNAWCHRGPTLELYLACAPATRGAIHRGGRLIRALSRAVESRRPMAPPPIDLAGVSCYADDEPWLRRLLARDDARAAVARLMRETPRAAAAVFFAPNAVRYMRRFQPLAELNAENLRRWVADLDALAGAVDAAGPSADALEPSRLEEWARTSRDRYLNRIFLGLGLLMLLMMTALFVFSWFFVGQS